MTLYSKKFLPYKTVNLLCLVLADVFLCTSFCFVFADGMFGLAYYNWLKYIDVGCIALIVVAILLGSILLTPNMLRGEPKSKKTLTIIFNIIQMFLLVILFLNLISFYENAEHILLLISIGLFMLGEIVLILGGVLVDKNLMLVSENSNLLGIPQFVKVYDKTSKQTEYTDIKQLQLTSIIKYNCIIPCVIVCVLGYLTIATLITINLSTLGLLVGKNCVWYIAFLAVIVMLCALSFMLLRIKISSVQFSYNNRWMIVALAIINVILMLILGSMMYFNVLGLNPVFLCVMFGCLVVLNYMLLIVFNNQKCLYSFVNNQL